MNEEGVAIVVELCKAVRDLMRETGFGTAGCELKWVQEANVAVLRGEKWLREQNQG